MDGGQLSRALLQGSSRDSAVRDVLDGSDRGEIGVTREIVR